LKQKEIETDIINNKYGKLTVMKYSHKEKNLNRAGYKHYYLCNCDCGTNGTLVERNNLKFGITKSCGCIHRESLIERNKETAKYKGESNSEDSRIFQIYGGMKDRCCNIKSHAYSNYGGRGIIICNEWLDDYFTFKEWALNNGYKNNLTIDRIDVSGNYEPSNCRWVTQKAQCNNKRNNKYITYKGRTQTLSEWCEELDLEYFRTKARFNTCHMTPEQAFELPKQLLRRKVAIE